MKKRLLFILLNALVLSCSLPDNDEYEKSTSEVAVSEILFQLRTSDKDDLEIFEDGIIPWISIKEPESDLNVLIDRDEIVLNSNKAVLWIDYPLSKPVEIQIASKRKDGFSRTDLIRLISQEYHRIYSEEEASAEVKTVPLEERTGLINRNKTDGKYGIWGHDIGDLDLSAIIVHSRNGVIPKLELFIES